MKIFALPRVLNWKDHRCVIFYHVWYNYLYNMPSFCRRHFQMHFIESKSCHFGSGFTKAGFRRTNGQYISIGTNNGLATIWRQAIIWTKNGIFPWHIDKSLGRSECSNNTRVVMRRCSIEMLVTSSDGELLFGTPVAWECFSGCVSDNGYKSQNYINCLVWLKGSKCYMYTTSINVLLMCIFFYILFLGLRHV